MITAIVSTGEIAVLVTAGSALVAAIGGVYIGMKNKGIVVEIKQLANGANDALRRRCAQLEDYIHSKGDVPPKDPYIAEGESEKR